MRLSLCLLRSEQVGLVVKENHEDDDYYEGDEYAYDEGEAVVFSFFFGYFVFFAHLLFFLLVQGGVDSAFDVGHDFEAFGRICIVGGD